MGKVAFPPIVNKDSKILILGTMPSERSLDLQQYYGHAGNHFWKLIFSLFNKPFSKDYSERTQVLLDNQVALWDVLEYCEGKGSNDNNIKNEIPNDLEKFYVQYPYLKTVFFSSKKAEKFYDKYVGKNSTMTYFVLPSPNSANAWKTFDQKLEEWKIIPNALLNK
jgi:hypoxanthine-DNA glycosylase